MRWSGVGWFDLYTGPARRRHMKLILPQAKAQVHQAHSQPMPIPLRRACLFKFNYSVPF